ncbi:MAG: hypothetical protein FGM58_10155 [Acidimicrobiia bacterium]|nr:hypothetical protein [Acidimicrobiia bacterium]
MTSPIAVPPPVPETPEGTDIGFERLERVFKWALVLASTVLFLWLSTNRTWDVDYSYRGQEFNATFFNEQAISMLDGRLDVPFAGYRWTECFIIDDKCFGYFGITPSILRFPVIAAGGVDAPALTPVFIAAAIAITMWAVIDLFQRVLRDLIPDAGSRHIPSIVTTLALALILGPGSILTLLARPRLYHEAILWMVAFLLVAMNHFHRWMTGRRSADLLVVVIAATLSACSRPSSAASAVVLGIGAGVVLHLDRRRSRPTAGRYTGAAALALLPGLTATGVLMMKFKIPGLPWNRYSLYSANDFGRLSAVNDGALQGLRFVPTNLVNYLRPDTLRLRFERPWVVETVRTADSVIHVWPVVVGGVFVEPLVSLTNAMTVPVVLTVVFTFLVLVGSVRLGRSEKQSYLILLMAAAACTSGTLVASAVTSRYVGDFYPVVAIGAVFALAHLARGLGRHVRLFTIGMATVSLVALASFYVELQMTTT